MIIIYQALYRSIRSLWCEMDVMVKRNMSYRVVISKQRCRVKCRFCSPFDLRRNRGRTGDAAPHSDWPSVYTGFGSPDLIRTRFPRAKLLHINLRLYKHWTATTRVVK